VASPERSNRGCDKVMISIHVPFLDLNMQYASLRCEMDAAVLGVLASGNFVGGPTVAQFEESFASFCGAKYAVGVANGTDAITLALRAAGVGPGHQVLVPANSFFASAEAVSNAGATPIFVDVDPSTFHMSPVLAAAAITESTRAILPVHLYGRAMDLRPIVELASRHKLAIIEDCAQAHGAVMNNETIGSSGRLTCYSFYPGKNLGAYGDGGAITTNDPGLARNLRVLREHGSAVKYQHDVIGWNSRLDALQAAVLSVKLPHLEGWNRARNEKATGLAKGLVGCATLAPEIPSNSAEHVFHLFVVRSTARETLQKYLADRGVQTGIHYPMPLHLTGAYRASGGGPGTMPVTETLASEILSLPMFPELTRGQIDHIAACIHEFEREYKPQPPEAMVGLTL